VREPRPWAVPVLSAAVSAVLSSGLTAAYVRATLPDVIATRVPFTTVKEHADVAALLVAPGPPYRPLSGGEPVDLAAQGASVEVLASIGYTRGWTRAWSGAGGERVDAYVLEFSGESGATAYARGIGRAATLLIKPVPFSVSGVPDGSGLADTVRDKSGRYAQVVALHRGRWAALLVFSAKERTPQASVVALAQRQYAALSAP
jgi:hypothetical protein